MIDSSKKMTYLIVGGLFLIALGMRLAYMFNLNVDNFVRGDSRNYVQYAENIREYGVFSKSFSEDPKPDAFWAPGYPTLLAAIFGFSEITGIDKYKLALFVQAVIGSGIVVLTYLLGRMFLPLGWSIASAGLVAFSPHLISLGGYILTEVLFGFLLIFALFAFAYGLAKQQRWWLLVSGVSFGFAYLVNPVVAITPLFLVSVYVFCFCKRENATENFIFVGKYALLCFVFIVASWQIRNAVNVSEGASSSDRAFINMVIGSHHNYHELWRANSKDPNNPAHVDLKNLDRSYLAFAQQLAERIAEDPVHYLKWYFVDKPILLWDWNIITGQGDIYVYPVNSSLYHVSTLALISRSLMKSIHYWLFGIALLGFFWVFKRGEGEESTVPSMLYISLISISAVYVILQSEARYSIPLRPEMYLCAMFGLKNIIEWIQLQRNKEKN